jgi:hypothetical protein
MPSYLHVRFLRVCNRSPIPLSSDTARALRFSATLPDLDDKARDDAAATGDALPVLELEKNDNNSRRWTTAGSWFTHGVPAVGFVPEDSAPRSKPN